MAGGSRKGKTEPRLWTPPLRKLTPDTTLGYDMIEFSHGVLGIEPLPWEAWLFIHAFEIIGEFGADWRLRFRVVLVLVARQNGKTYVTKIIALFFLYMLGVALILGCAQDLTQAEETWESTVMEAEAHYDLKKEIVKVKYGKGSNELRLSKYRRYKIATPNDKNMRGKTADLVFLDEVRTHQTFAAWNAASRTIKARPSAAVWCISNAGTSSSVVLRRLRMQAHKMLGDPDGFVAACTDGGVDEITEDEAKALESIAIFEWSATPGCDMWDRNEWAQANPSLGYGFLDEASIASEAVSGEENDFRVEDLCQWIMAVDDPPFPNGAWEAGTDEGSEVMPSSPVCFGVDASAQRREIFISACGVRADGSWHVEVIAKGTSSNWLLEWFRSRVYKYGGRMRVALQGSGAPVSAYADLLAAVDGVEVTECKSTRDMSAWTGRFYDSVVAGIQGAPDTTDDGTLAATPIYHIPQPALDVAAQTAATRKTGDGLFVFDREKSREEIAPLVSCVMAFGLATTPYEDDTRVSAYTDADLLVLD